MIEPTTSNAVPLDYGRPGKRRRFRWAGRAAALAIILLAGVFACRRWGPTVRTRWGQMQQDKPLLAYTRPPDTVVMTSNRQVGEQLLAGGRAYQATGPQIGSEDWSVPYSYVYLDVTEWQAYPAGGWYEGLAFLHERISPSGHRRLVAVCFDVQGNPLVGHRLRLLPGVIEPASFAHDRSVRSAPLNSIARLHSPYITVRLGPDVRLFAGQPDPADRSHFTLTWAAGEATHVVDGWLKDNDTIDLRPLDGQLTHVEDPAASEFRWEPPADGS